VTAKPLPVELSAPGWAFTSLEESIMVISSFGNVEMTPEAEPDVTVEPVSVQEWKSASGSTPDELLGASAIHSALELAQSEQVWVVEKLLAVWVESVTASV
jgi:hypothetical protein